MPDPNNYTRYKSTETEHLQKYIKVVTIGTIGKDHSLYRKALFQYFRKDLGIPARTTYAESDFCNYINAKIDCLKTWRTNPSKLTRVLNSHDYLIQQPVESDPEEYKNESNNPVTAQAKSMVNKKPRVLSPTTLSYHQTPQSRIVFNSPPETHWTKLLEKYGSLFGNLTPTATQNLAESAFPLIEETAILQFIGSSDKEKQPALAPGEHSNTRTPIPLNITSNTPPINRIMAYRDIAKLEKFSGEEDNAYSWITNAEKAITANGWNDNHTVQALLFFLTGTANLWFQSLTEKPTSFTKFKLAFLLQDAVTFACNFESAEQEANHTQAINLAINKTSDIDAKITQLSKKLTQKIERFLAGTTGTYQPLQWRKNNNNSRYPQQQNYPIPATATIARNLDISPVTAEGRSWTKIKETHTSNPDIIPYTQPPPQNYYQPPPITQAISYYQTSPYSPSRPRAINYNQEWRNSNNNQVQTNSGPSRPIPRSPAQSRPTPTGYPNQASYLGLMEDQGFDKSTPMEEENIE
ncbi:hypothetical protein G9A89_018214 [Geosiphon pyriformis]|nr:hypothetical protein G9A89_018214 [Geosiphon pyriformis]